MSPAAETQLRTEVAAIRTSIEAGDEAGATAQLAQLRISVAALATSNYITADRALTINDAIAELEQQLAARVATTTTVTTAATVAATTTTRPTTTTTPPTTTAAQGPGKRDKDKKG
jgi:hypothetical protein